MTYSATRTRILRALTVVAAALFVIGLYLALFWVGPEKDRARRNVFSTCIWDRSWAHSLLSPRRS